MRAKSNRVWWSTTVVLAGGLALTYWVSHPAGGVPQPGRGVDVTLGSASSGQCMPVDPLPGVSSAGAGSVRHAEPSPPAIAAVQQELALLSGEVAALQRQLRTLQSTPPVGAAESVEAPPDQRLDPAARAAAERVRQEQMAMLEAAFRREPIDRAWAFQTTGTVQEVLESDPVGQAALQGLECHSRTCRVELAVDNSGDLGKSLPLLLQQLALLLPSVTANTVEEGAGERMILYLSGDMNAPVP